MTEHHCIDPYTAGVVIVHVKMSVAVCIMVFVGAVYK